MNSRVGVWAMAFLFAVGCASTVSKPESQPSDETASAAEAEVQQEMVSVTANRLNLRLRATIKSRIIGVLNKGDTIAVLNRTHGWVNVQTGSGKRGWVAERYTIPAGSIPVSVLVQQSPIPAATTPAVEPVVQDTPPAQIQESSLEPQEQSSKAPKKSFIVPRKADQASTAHSSPAASPAVPFTREDAIALYRHHHKVLTEGDLKTYFAFTLDPPDPEEMSQASPEELARLRDMLIEMTPDLAKCEVLKFNGSEQTAILVVRSNLDSADSITLTPLKFVAVEGEWKIEPGLYFDTLPRQDPQTDTAAISLALETNPNLQLASVGTGEKPTTAATSSAPLPPADPVPSEAGVVVGELVINGESTPLKYAYAYSEPSFFDKTKTDTVVILSNMALDDEGIENWAKRSELEDIGKLCCIELTINSGNKVISRRLRHAVFDGSPSGVSGSEVYEPLQAEKGVVAGKAYSTRESDIFGVTYQYRVSFMAQLRQAGQSPP